MRIAEHVSPKATPQTEPIPHKPMVQNSAGGYSFAVDDWARLDRFLVLGSDGGTYYATERALTVENAKSVVACAKADAAEAVRRIVAVSDAGRAPKNDYAVFALALVAAHADGPGKSAAYSAVPKVCRIGTHLFQFASASNALRGWGKGLRAAIGNWYASQEPKNFAFQAMKYQQRDGWSHRDLLRLSHQKFENADSNAVARWAVKGWESVGEQPHENPNLAPIWAFERAKLTESVPEIVKLISEYRLPRECVPTKFLTEPAVWEALLDHMNMTALIRNLATMTKVGLVKPMSNALVQVVGKLGDIDGIKKARVHPLALLVALVTYASGRSVRGSAEWKPVQQVSDALDRAFYRSFEAVEPTGKRFLLGVDVSGSMGSNEIAGMAGMTPRVAAAAMALVTASTEKLYHVMGFSNQFVPLNVSPQMRMDTVVQNISGLPFQATDCGLPMVYAMQNKIPVDTFIVYTDNETYAGPIHPKQAIDRYRQATGIPAKLVVVGMASNGFTIADPSDAGMMDVVGFDTAAPAVIADFSC